MHHNEENVNEHDTQGGHEQRDPWCPLDKGAQQLHRTGDPASGTRQVPTGVGGDERSHAQERTGRLSTCDHNHDEHDYARSDERFDQLYAFVRNTAGYVNSMRTT
jgi:hypothetical protein